jgi:Ran GTPase-activating protein (RanGAP) involved in mRNA processing and transport
MNHSHDPSSFSPLAHSNNTTKSTLQMNRSIGPAKRKTNKLQEKSLTLLAIVRADQIEYADFSGSELGDDGLALISECLRFTKKLKVVKLMRNNIGDEGAIKLFESAIQSKYIIIHTYIIKVSTPYTYRQITLRRDP